jgi:DNA-binding transcriptional regulator YiaG
MSAKGKSMGAEITDRLRKFTEKIEKLENVSELPEVLTVRKVKLDLRPRNYSSDEVREIRKLLKVSQPVLAEFLGVSPSTVKDWEQGVCPPQGPACRILEEMQRDLELWAKRIRDLATVTAE